MRRADIADGEIKDYGGHRPAMNRHGVTLKDVWTDIPPVRHAKYKPNSRTANRPEHEDR